MRTKLSIPTAPAGAATTGTTDPDLPPSPTRDYLAEIRRWYDVASGVDDLHLPIHTPIDALSTAIWTGVHPRSVLPPTYMWGDRVEFEDEEEWLRGVHTEMLGEDRDEEQQPVGPIELRMPEGLEIFQKEGERVQEGGNQVIPKEELARDLDKLLEMTTKPPLPSSSTTSLQASSSRSNPDIKRKPKPSRSKLSSTTKGKKPPRDSDESYLDSLLT